MPENSISNMPTTDAQIQFEQDKLNDCPDCLGKLLRITIANGPDDYDVKEICNTCGYEASE